jgi:hypothetical protein
MTILPADCLLLLPSILSGRGANFNNDKRITGTGTGYSSAERNPPAADLARRSLKAGRGLFCRALAALKPEQRQPNPTDHEQRSGRRTDCYEGNESFDYLGDH